MTEEDLIKEKAEKEKKLGNLLTDRMEALSKIKGMVSEQSALEKQLDNIDAQEEELDQKLIEIKKRISAASKEMDASNTEEEELAAHKKKTALLEESAKVEDELDDITRKKVDILDKVKALTRSRSELEGTWDRVEAEEILLKKEVMELRQKTEGFMHQMSREIGEMDQENIEEKAAEKKRAPEAEVPVPEPAPEKPAVVPAAPPETKQETLKDTSAPAPKAEKPKAAPEPKQEKPEPKQEKKSIFNVFGKKEKEEPEINIGMLKAVLKIMDGLLEKLPEDVIDKFSKSADYDKYEKLYHTVEEYKGTEDEKAHIKANAKTVLITVDNLLRQLPKEVLDDFAESDDFDRYNKVLEGYGVG